MGLSRQDRRVQRLDLMSYQEKCIQWKSEDPLGAGIRLTTEPSLKPDQVTTDGRGNITSIPEFAGKPCFGVPTAWLRHAHRKPVYVKRLDERVHNRPCDRCQCAAACKKVVLERIGSVSSQDRAFREAFKTWHAEGGLGRGGFDRAYAKLGPRGWSALTYPIETAEFEDANAPFVRLFWIEREAEARKKAAGKERYRLREAWRRAEELEVLRNGLTAGAKQRATWLYKRWNAPDCPPYLKRVRQASIVRLCNVWWAREYARFTGQDLNASRIATIAIDNCRSDIAHSSLRQLVKKDLEKIRKLESDAAYNGGIPVWPKFKHPALS